MQNLEVEQETAMALAQQIDNKRASLNEMHEARQSDQQYLAKHASTRRDVAWDALKGFTPSSYDEFKTTGKKAMAAENMEDFKKVLNESDFYTDNRIYGVGGNSALGKAIAEGDLDKTKQEFSKKNNEEYFRKQSKSDLSRSLGVNKKSSKDQKEYNKVLDNYINLTIESSNTTGELNSRLETTGKITKG